MNALISSLMGAAGGALTNLTAPGANRAAEPPSRGFASLLAAALTPLARTPGGADAETSGIADGLPEEGAEDGVLGMVPLVLTTPLTTPKAGASATPASGESGAAPATAPAPDVALPTADLMRVYRGVDRLDPELRERFERLVARMSDEFGHRVEIVETYRSQARQEALFEQGRTRPGSVVTWTRHSNHTEGRAVDVMIDGTYDNPLGYARLARIAAEEGLRTLGARDPGHVELRAAGSGATSTPAPAPGGLARVAEVARVADVARVATVAQVAQVARPGAPAPRGPGRVAQDTPASAAASVPIPAAPGELEIAIDPSVGAREQAPLEGRSRQGPDVAALADKRAGWEEEALRAEAAAGGGVGEGGRSSEPQTGSVGTSARTSPATPRAEVVVPAGVDVAGRIARAIELQESRAGQPLTHMLLRLENPGGTEDRIRVDLRGGSVDATLEIGSVADAGRLNARVEELTRALERHGLEAESVRIRTTPAATADAAEALRVAAALGDSEALRAVGSRGGSDGSFSRDRGDTAPRDQPRDHSDQDPRHRSRREHKGGKEQ